MDLHRDLAALPPRTAACLGAFDGMHLGHQALVLAAAKAAPKVAVAAFEPHPASVLRPEQPRLRLQSEGQRARVCEALGVHTLVRLPFDRRVASLEPAEFVREFIVNGLAPEVLVVGEDFRFGRGRLGDADLLRSLLSAAGCPTEVEVVDELRDPDSKDAKVGSTRIRAHVRAGALEAAAKMLGRLYAVAGPVGHGAARGRTIGRPTANVDTEGTLLPPTGVYAAVLSVVGTDGLEPPMSAVANLGTNPTFTGANDDGSVAPGLEVHVLDRDLQQALYGRRVEVAFVARIREERRFSGPDALAQAIGEDIAFARSRLGPGVLQRIVPARIVVGVDE